MALTPEVAAQLKEVQEAIAKNTQDARQAFEKKAEEMGEKAAKVDETVKRIDDEYVKLSEKLSNIEVALKRPQAQVDAKDANPTDLIEKANKDGVASLTEAERDRAQGHVFIKWVRGQGAFEGLTPEERKFALEYKASVLSDDTNAGYLAVPNDMVRGILGNVREKSPVRQLADVRSGSARAIEQPRRTADFSASWVGETATRSETTGHTHGMETITAHEMYAQIHVSRQMLADSAYDLESYFRDLTADAFAVLEGTAFISGTGVGQPEGIEGNSGITTRTAASSGTIAPDDLINAVYDLKEPYRSRASWLVNRTNVARIRRLKDGSGAYLWQPSLAAGEPATLLGFPLREATDLDSTEAASSNVALFADFRSGYRIYDRIGMQVLRDPFNSKDTGLVEFDFFRRVGGGVILPEAIVLYQL